MVLEIQSAHPTVQSYHLPPARVNFSSSYAGTAIHVNQTPLYTAGPWLSETCEAYLSSSMATTNSRPTPAVASTPV